MGMGRMRARLVRAVGVVLGLLFGLRPGAAEEEPAHPPLRPATPQFTKVETTLLTVPSEEKGLKVWHDNWWRYVKLAADFEIGPSPINRQTTVLGVTAFSIENQSPCNLTISSAHQLKDLKVFAGQGAKDQPPQGGPWTVPQFGRLVLKSRASDTPKPFGSGSAKVEAVVKGLLCTIRIQPTYTELPPLDLMVWYSVGIRGKRAVTKGVKVVIGALAKDDEEKPKR